MNIKVAIGEIFKKMGLLNFSLKLVRKFGYLTKFTDHHSNGIDLITDISADTKIQDIKVVLDVGASIGSMTDYFLNIFPQSVVHCFEPYDPSFKTLISKYGNNNKVVANQLGLSNEHGELKMYLQSDSGYNSLSDLVNKPSQGMDGKYQTVTVTTIGDYCVEKGIDHIDFIKIDTEGLDLKVLQGCEAMLKAGKVKYIFVECTFNKDNPQNTPFEVLNNYLQEFGFKVRAIYDQSNYGDKTFLTCVNAMFMLQK
jgi:FkbM family methyltransferase